MDIKECRRKFDIIVEGRENEGYVEWKKWITEEIKKYDDNSLANLVKRCEIEYKKLCEDDGFKIFPIFTHLLSTILIVIPFVGNVMISSFGILSGTYQEAIEEAGMKEYATIVNESISKLSSGIFSLTIIGIAIFIILLPIMSALDAQIAKVKSNKKIFWEELTVILKKCLRKRKSR